MKEKIEKKFKTISDKYMFTIGYILYATIGLVFIGANLAFFDYKNINLSSATIGYIIGLYSLLLISALPLYGIKKLKKYKRPQTLISLLPVTISALWAPLLFSPVLIYNTLLTIYILYYTETVTRKQAIKDLLS